MPELKEIRPLEAWAILEADPAATLIDVRSRMEFDYVGHAPNANNISWAEPPDWKVIPGFADRVRALLSKQHDGPVEEVPILAICRSGARSRSAGQVLLAAGFVNVYNVLEGFEGERDPDKHRGAINGWRFHGLPWEQS